MPKVYVYDRELGIMVDKETRAPMVDPTAPYVPSAPISIADIEPFRSPVSGEYISGRRAKRADLDRHNCIDANELPSKTGGKLKNKRFAKKWGMEHLLHDDAKE